MNEYLFDAIAISLEVEDLVNEGHDLQSAPHRLNPHGSLGEPSRADIGLRRDDLLVRALAMREVCERSLSRKRDIMDRKSWDDVPVCDPDERPDEWVGDQCERIGHCLVRVIALIDRLHCMQ